MPNVYGDRIDDHMHRIHEVATLTSKGQITVPQPIRQADGAARLDTAVP
jgi:bifunctional DNA-binding transcriptional regulator/antitoxin component of YhaV-PrlF toxin-antitoxin module